MRALTLTQPWCGLVASGIKLVENRPRKLIKSSDFGKPFALHASREIDNEIYERIFELAPELRCGGIDGDEVRMGHRWFGLSQIKSAVIAVATIVRHVTSAEYEYGTEAIGEAIEPNQRRWFFGPVGYVLRDVIALPKPIPCRGYQGFWTLPEEISAAVSAQLSTPEIRPTV